MPQTIEEIYRLCDLELSDQRISTILCIDRHTVSAWRARRLDYEHKKVQRRIEARKKMTA